jgi:SAM-dependent methyltransferase
MNQMDIDGRIKEAYKLEKALARKLRYADHNDRKELYNAIYAEYYEKFPEHPFIFRDNEVINKDAQMQVQYLRRFLASDMIFVEIGPGAGAVSLEVAKYVKEVYAVDVSEAPMQQVVLPENVKLVISNGVNIPSTIPSAHIVYSSHVIEHLHPDDAREQIKDIFNILRGRGLFICRTPHRYSGPHDISKYFDNVSTCFHMKEYTISELNVLMRSAGFRRIKCEVNPKGVVICIPLLIIKGIEQVIGRVPIRFRRALSRTFPLRVLFNFSLLGEK